MLALVTGIQMAWVKRLAIAAPFAVAAVLNVLLAAAKQLHLYTEHIVGYGFLFATPWGWLIGLLQPPHIHNRSLQALLGYVLFLWIPAALYSACLYFVFLGFEKVRTPKER